MTVTWIWLLLAALVTGMTVTALLVVPRPGIPLAALVSLLGASGMFLASRTTGTFYGTTEAWLLVSLFCVAGLLTGYRLAAALLNRLAPAPRPFPLPSPSGSRPGVVLLHLTDPPHYDPRAVATLIEPFASGRRGDIPAAAIPFVFATTRARYRATGDISPATPLLSSLADRITDILTVRFPDVTVRMTSAVPPHALTNTVAALAAAGCSRIAVVTIGSPDVGPSERARTILEREVAREPAISVGFGRSIWTDPALSDRLAERIAASRSTPADNASGVVLVGSGMPPGETEGVRRAEQAEQSFHQRVQLAMTKRGVSSEHVRQAWLDWHEPDVTDAVRHLAALGCTQILVAPSTIAMPGVSTSPDLATAVSLARVPEGVSVVTMPPWGDAEGLAQTIADIAIETLESLR